MSTPKIKRQQKKKPLFPLGEVFVTPGVRASVVPRLWLEGIARHQYGDWGDVCPQDARSNDLDVDQGMLLSAYPTPDGVTFWILTE